MPTTDSKIHLITATTESPTRNVVDKGHSFATTSRIGEHERAHLTGGGVARPARSAAESGRFRGPDRSGL